MKIRNGDTVRFRCRVKAPLEAGELARWSADWYAANQHWTREWSDGRIDELAFHDEFAAAPNLFVEGDDLVLELVLAEDATRLWRDWLAKLGRAVSLQFEIGPPKRVELKPDDPAA